MYLITSGGSRVLEWGGGGSPGGLPLPSPPNPAPEAEVWECDPGKIVCFYIAVGEL